MKHFNKENRNAMTVFALLTMILLFGFILRIYGLGENSLWVDEAISSLAAKNIILKGLPVFDSGLFYGRALVFHYLTAFSLALFGGDFGVRLVSVFFGLATIVLTFFIGKEFRFEKKGNYVAGLVSALFSAVIFLEIAYSRQARFYQMFQFLFFLTLYLLYHSKHSRKYAWFSTASFIFLVDTHLAGLILAPLIINLFIREHKDWKIVLVPIIISLIYLPRIFSIPLGSWDIAFHYADIYSSSLFFYLGAFSLLSILGIFFAYKLNRRLTLLFVIPTGILLCGVFLLKVFALRYVYFAVFLVPIFLGVIFSYLYTNNKILFTLVLGFALIYPSNLIFSSNAFILLKPESAQLNTLSEPVLEYKGLSQNTANAISKSKSVVLFTSSLAWYLKSPDYFIPFSFNGISNEYNLYEGKDPYTGSKVFNFTNPQTKKFVLIEDAFGYSKLKEEAIEQLAILKKDCELLEEIPTLKVYECKLS